MRIYPFHIETLLLGAGEHRIANIDENYMSLKFHPGGEMLEAENLRGSSMPEKKGVCLHFILPDEWKHGEQDKDGKIFYRKLPNRWSVTRYAVYEEANKRMELSRRDWIVESDLVKDKQNSDVRGSRIGYEDEQHPLRILGEQREYDGKISSEGTHLENLTAASKGMDYFTGYYPECRTVLGFYDPMDSMDSMTGIREIKSGEEEKKRYLLTYAVSGWYEGDEEKEEKSICHGYVTDIRWFGPDYRYDSGIPRAMDMPRIVLGNSAEEAVAALLARYSGKKEDEKLLKNLFYESLSGWKDMDGFNEGQRKIRQGKFVPVASPEKLVIEGEEVLYTEKKAELLGRIEELRRNREQVEEELQKLYESVYLMWVRAAGWDTEYLKEACERILEAEKQICLLQCEYQDTYGQEKEEGLKQELSKLLGEKETLKETAGERYWRPADYTVLMEGAAQSNIYRKIEAWMEEGKTPFRDAEDIISNVQISVPKEDGESTVFHFSYQDLKENFVTLPSPEHSKKNELPELPETPELPEVPEKLAQEAGLISRGAIYYLAESILEQMGYEKTPINMTHIIQSYENSLENGGADKNLPSPIGRFLWKPSWNPLFLEWSLMYFPGKQKNESDKMEICGRSVLTSTSADALLKLFDEQGQGGEYSACVKKLKSLRVLSQKLSGIHDALLTRTRNILVNPEGAFPPDIMKIVKEAFANLKEGYLDRNHVQGRKKEALEEFHEIREGILSFSQTKDGKPVGRFRVIDSFGRILDYDASELIVSDEISQKSVVTEFETEKRIVAPLRINAAWNYIRKNADTDEVSPVYGWLLPNLADSCLHIYGPDGILAGTIQAFYIKGEGREKKVKIALRNPPGGTQNEEELIRKRNPMLRDFLKAFLDACRKEPQTFTELLRLLDDSMWDVYKGMDQESGSLCRFMGHPVALVGVTVGVEMKGTPPSPVFYHGEEYESKLLSMEYRTKVGETGRQKDGTIGFYDMGREGFSKLHHCVREPYQGAYYTPDTELSLHLDKKEELAVLLSPKGELAFDMGLLPVKCIKLNEKMVEKALQSLQMIIPAAPILTHNEVIQVFAAGEECKFIEIYQPEEQGILREIKEPVMESGQQYKDVMIREGWISLENSERKKAQENE